MKLLTKLLACALLLSVLAAPVAAEMLDLSALGDIQEAQMFEEPAAQKEWTYPISYELLTGSEYIVLANKQSLLNENYVPEDLVEAEEVLGNL